MEHGTTTVLIPSHFFPSFFVHNGNGNDTRRRLSENLVSFCAEVDPAKVLWGSLWSALLSSSLK